MRKKESMMKLHLRDTILQLLFLWGLVVLAAGVRVAPTLAHVLA